ncbi:hypothetical protein [Microbacterium sp. Marseille-Q6965]|uniref:hypothetical protein n=1 Tax=Microbacterium sp. Marseille-Q6965 TaxID=2965072 RepID=UPI0021B844AD|nr:hypothetical protein [Microbacterium sp. Marseille-Q6965]
MAHGEGRTRRRGRVITTLGVVLIAAGAVMIGAYVTMPQQTERAYGELKTRVTDAVDDVREQVFDELPTVRIGAVGGISELDRCDGTFTVMTSYEREGVPETAAAHNSCGGDVVLTWDEGQRVRIEGRDETYEVVDIRYTSKIWSSTADLVGLGGEIALQTCFYGEDRMKFVGLAPVDS